MRGAARGTLRTVLATVALMLTLAGFALAHGKIGPAPEPPSIPGVHEPPAPPEVPTPVPTPHR